MNQAVKRRLLHAVPHDLRRLGVIGLEETGEYLVLALDENGNDVGEYSLAFQILNSSECSLPTGCGAEFTSVLTRKAEIDAYTFEAAAGDVIVAHMRGEVAGVEARMELYDPEGNFLAKNDNRGRLGILRPVVLPASGTYILLAMDDGGNDTGSYAMSLQFTNSYTNCLINLDCNSIKETWNLGSTAEIDAFTFEGAANEKLSIKLSEIDDNLEPRFELYAPDGSEVANASSGNVANRENIILPADGSYTLLVMDYEGNDEGRYQIDISSKSFVDTEAPIAICQSVTIQLEAGGTYTLMGEEVDAGSTDNCGIASMSVADGTFDCDDIGTTKIVMFTVTDESGNSSSCEVSVTIEDPNFACGWVYCEAQGGSTDFEWIENISIGDIYNASGDDGGYGDYTDQITDLSVSSNQVIIMNPGFINANASVLECWGVWIDFNNDGDFDDTGEQVIRKSSKSTIYGSIAIPAYAAIGVTRMRIAMNYEAYPVSCDPFNYGEVEDYSVNIIPAVECEDLPAGWANTDIGDYEVGGISCYQSSNKTFAVSSASGDIYNDADNFEFAYHEWCGDGEIVARLTGMIKTSNYALAGIMFRKKLQTGSKNVALLATPENGMYLQVRAKHHGYTDAVAVSGGSPVWMKLKREGNQFTGYTSLDGENWTSNYSIEVKGMGECIYAGMAVAANVDDATTYNTATFDNVYVGVSTDNADEQSGESGQSAGFVKQGPNGELIEGIVVQPSERGEGNPSLGANETSIQLETTRTTAAFDINTIQLFPNPTVDYVQVDLRKLEAEAVEIVIYNAAGQLLWQQAANAKSIVHIDLKDVALSAGQYWVSVRHKGGQLSKPLVIKPRA